jgi:hypothetical protein
MWSMAMPTDNLTSANTVPGELEHYSALAEHWLAISRAMMATTRVTLTAALMAA